MIIAANKSRYWRRLCSVYKTLVRHVSLAGIHAIALLAGVSCGEKPLSVDDLVDRNVNAMGGAAALHAVQSVKIDLHIVDPGFEVNGSYYAARPGKMRIDITAGGKHVYTEAFNGNRGWQWKGEGDPVAESAKATAALRHGVELPGNLFGLDEVRQRGAKLELVGREHVDGINYYLLNISLADGYSTTLYIDPNTWFITRRRDVRPLHVDIDPTPTSIERRSSDFRQVEGVMFPFASLELDLKSGKELERATINSITLNPPIEPSFFDRL